MSPTSSHGPRDGVAEVVVVGSVNRDYVCQVDPLPHPGQTVLGGEVSVGSGGKGGNQAAAAGLLGARTSLIARVGDDVDGRALTSDLDAVGVDTREVAVLPDVRTGTAFVFVAADGENSIVVAPGANGRLTGAQIDETLPRVLRAPAVLVTQAEIPDDALHAAISSAARLGCRAIVNLAPFRPVPAEQLALCDPLVVNESEASDLLGSEIRGVESAKLAAQELLGRARSVVITVGAEGAVAAANGVVVHVAAEPTTVVDTTGAGDAFTGALAVALSRGSDLESATRLGVRVGSYAVARTGAQASYPRPADLGLPATPGTGHAIDPW
jgi:ribokinase